MLRVNSIAGKILEIDESILSVAVVDMRGQIVSSKSSTIVVINLYQIMQRQTVVFGQEQHSQ
jgi:hypothetical protein